MANRFEEHILGYRNAELFMQSWQVDQAKGVLLITHGIAEHSECYEKLANDLNQKGYTVFAWDLRGHGRSSGQRGYVESFDEFEKDLRIVVAKVKESCPETPLILFGHSMGGLITLKNVIANGPQGARVLVLSSPGLGISLPVPALKKRLLKWYQNTFLD